MTQALTTTRIEATELRIPAIRLATSPLVEVVLDVERLEELPMVNVNASSMRNPST